MSQDEINKYWLRWFLNDTVFSKLVHVLLDALQAVVKMAIVQGIRLGTDPLKKAGHKRLVIVLQVLHVQKSSKNL